AETALAFLDVGLECVARRAEPLVPHPAFVELGLVERLALPRHAVLVEALAELVEQVALAPQIARLKERREDGEVALGARQALVDRARRLPDLQPQVPQAIED